MTGGRNGDTNGVRRASLVRCKYGQDYVSFFLEEIKTKSQVEDWANANEEGLIVVFFGCLEKKKGMIYSLICT